MTLSPSVLLIDPLYTPENLSTAAAVGCESVTVVWPASKAHLESMLAGASSSSLRVDVCEGYPPHEMPLLPIINHTPGVAASEAARAAALAECKEKIRWLGEAGVSVCCYNWMPTADWTRTRVDEKERGGSLVTAFVPGESAAAALAAMGLDQGAHRDGSDAVAACSAEQLWANLESFLREVLPVCEASGVKLAMHPDDPPLPELNGRAQIMFDAEQLERCCRLVPSPYNGVAFCQGSLAAADEALVPAIERLAEHIHFVHFRDVVGSARESGGFREAWTDTGKSDMAACMRAYLRVLGGRGVPIRPDHTPVLACETSPEHPAGEFPGYTVMGRLFAVGYIRGLIDAAQR